MIYYTLQEAAEQVGHGVSAAELLRLGAGGHFLICAGFSGEAYSPTNKGNIDALGLYVLPPRHLFEIESNGETVVRMATSLDGKEIIFPNVVIGRDALRVACQHLDEFKFRLVVKDSAGSDGGAKAVAPATEATPGTDKRGAENPWLVHDARDPTPHQPWYTPARYFARALVRDDSTLLTKRRVLAGKVAHSLTNAGIRKRGGKKPLDEATVLKAFVNVNLG